MRAPAESTSQNTGSSWRRAYSVRRTIFSTVRAPHEPALTVGSLAITHTGRPSMRPDAGDHAVGRQVVGGGVGQQTVLDEGARVEQQLQAVADEQLALAGELVGLLVEVALQGPVDAARLEVVHRPVLARGQPERRRTRSLIGTRAEVERLAQAALEVAQVGGRQLAVGEQGERRRVGRALQGVEDPDAVRAPAGPAGPRRSPR